MNTFEIRTAEAGTTIISPDSVTPVKKKVDVAVLGFDAKVVSKFNENNGLTRK